MQQERSAHEGSEKFDLPYTIEPMTAVEKNNFVANDRGQHRRTSARQIQIEHPHFMHIKIIKTVHPESLGLISPRAADEGPAPIMGFLTNLS